MKNKRPLFVVLLCLLLAGGVVLALLPRCPMPWQCSKLYWQYRGQEGIEASYVRDYLVDDTTLVDVTLLHATTDSAWESLCHEFILPEFPDLVIENIIHGHSVTQWTASIDDPQIVVTPTSTSDYDLVAIAPQVEIIYIFHPENESQTDAIITKLVTEL